MNRTRAPSQSPVRKTPAGSSLVERLDRLVQLHRNGRRDEFVRDHLDIAPVPHDSALLIGVEFSAGGARAMNQPSQPSACGRRW